RCRPFVRRKCFGSILIELTVSYDHVRTLSSVADEHSRTPHARARAGYHARVITLGIDPGTAICGFGVVALDEGRLQMVDAGCIRTPSDASDAERLRQLHDALGELIAQHRPERIGVERLFFQRNVQT